MCSADPECTQHSSFPKSEAPVLVDLTTKLAKKLVVQPPATVGLGLCSQLFSMFSPFIALELSALKPWLGTPTKESDCTVNCLWLPREACFDQVHCTDLDVFFSYLFLTTDFLFDSMCPLEISSLSCPPPRRVPPVPQTAEQLVDVPLPEWMRLSGPMPLAGCGPACGCRPRGSTGAWRAPGTPRGPARQGSPPRAVQKYWARLRRLLWSSL